MWTKSLLKPHCTNFGIKHIICVLLLNSTEHMKNMCDLHNIIVNIPRYLYRMVLIETGTEISISTTVGSMYVKCDFQCFVCVCVHDVSGVKQE